MADRDEDGSELLRRWQHFVIDDACEGFWVVEEQVDGEEEGEEGTELLRHCFAEWDGGLMNQLGDIRDVSLRQILLLQNLP